MTYIDNLERKASKINIEEELNSFIIWVLRVTTNGEYSGEAAMDLLDQAWIAQKLVWRLRELKDA